PGFLWRACGSAKRPHPVQPRPPAQTKSRRACPAASKGGVDCVREAVTTPLPTLLLRFRLALRTRRAHAIAHALPAMHPAAMTVHMVPTTSAEPRQHDQAVLLILVQTLVERAGCVRDFLEHGTALHHRVGAQVEPLDRILRPVGAGARGKALAALLGEIAQRAFHCRPALLL